MGSILRSEDMSLVQLTMQREAAHDTVASFGNLGLIQFKDLSADLNAFQRQYANDIKRCDELERILRYFEKQLKDSEIKRAVVPLFEGEEPATNTGDLFALETEFEEKEKELLQLNSNLEQMTLEKNKSEELTYVIKQGEAIFSNGQDEELPGNVDSGNGSSDYLVDDNSSLANSARSGGLGYVTGVIPQSKIPTFVLLIYRVTRGNMIPRFSEIPEKLFDQKSGTLIEKSVFTVFFGAQRAREMIKKICESLGANIHEYPSQDVISAQRRLNQKINELEQTINTTELRRNDILTEVSTHFESWKRKIAVEKAVYNALNMMDYKIPGSVIAEGWVPSKHLETIRYKLSEARLSSGAQIESYMEELRTDEVPPTFFETNKFTACFQDIVNAYGVPRYKEVNPAVFAIISFPFLFAVMFGDWGHGIILALFGLSVIVFENKLYKMAEESEMFGMIFHGRYILFMMGLFSIFTGLIYNDVFGLSLGIFGQSGYTFHHDASGRNVGTFSGDTYVFGVDPAWYGTSNKLLFYNSLKMKTSVIFGVVQMSLGIILAGVNMIYFGHYFDFVVEFIPELLLLWCSFGYMCVLIVVKWCRSWTEGVNRSPILGGVPAILPTMTDFFLRFTTLEQPRVFGTPSNSHVVPAVEGTNEQLRLQQVLLAIFAISIPVLLIPKPVYDHYFHKKHHHVDHSQHTHLQDDDIMGTGDVNHADTIVSVNDVHKATNHGEQVEESPFSEKMIKQLIHTIEFVLGVVSNTASYLRLWALSLAHAQLSEVFWDMTIKLLLTNENAIAEFLAKSGIGLVVIWAVWFVLTIGVLLLMESLSAFLHALRLHWVEFQNKFFAGDGHLFQPFHISSIIKAAEKENRED
ncbi:vacuolar ATPase 116 kDa subunit [Acrasis kona]|uniref:V-type proton ATPase subunit a n=1 Tax=Acrasis kona TaxID=1008807 RepID=A0AAW2YMN8_9EUKA